MRDDERNRRSPVAFAPLRDNAVDGFGYVILTGSGVLQQRAVFSEEQIQKRLLVIRTAGFANDIEIRIVGVHLPFRHGSTVGASGDPVRGKITGFESRSL